MIKPEVWKHTVKCLTYYFTKQMYSSLGSALILAGIYLLKVNNGNSITECEICSKLTIKTPEHVIDVVVVALLLTLNRDSTYCFCASMVDLNKEISNGIYLPINHSFASC